MTSRLKGMLAAVAAVLAIGGTAASGSVHAQVTIPLEVSIEVWAPGAGGVMDDLVVEVWPEVGDAPYTTCEPGTTFGTELSRYIYIDDCANLIPGTYQIGVDGAPAGATVTASCAGVTILEERIPGTGTTFTADLQNGDFIQCDIEIVQPAVLVDKIVDGGDAAPGDFTLEVYGNGGEPVATDTDDSTELCSPFDPLTNCAVIPLPAGDYQLGEAPAPGYLPSNVACIPVLPFALGERFPAGVGEISLFDEILEEQYPFAYCQVTNSEYSGSLIVEKEVVNDDGGTATAADFTAEVFLDGSALDIDGACDANGDCVAVTIPVGEYRIGETGPDGYAPSVACTVTREPDYGIGTTPPTTDLQIREAIAGDAALAQVEPFGEVTCVITNDDIATTTTVAPTTTDAGGQPAVPTTVAPSLPATGSGDANVAMTLVALGLLTLGGSLLALRRR